MENSTLEQEYLTASFQSIEFTRLVADQIASIDNIINLKPL